MRANTFGHLLRVTSFGESHGPSLGVVIDGLPPGLEVDLELVQAALDRRRPGQSNLHSRRREGDRVQLLAGLFRGATTGAPLALVVHNEDADPAAYEELQDCYRPGHADYAYQQKYGRRDHRGGGRSSGRETVSRVAAGAVAAQLLTPFGVEVQGWVQQVGPVVAQRFEADAIHRNPLRCPDAAAALEMAALLQQVQQEGDSLGGRVCLEAQGVPTGLGDPVFGKLDAALAGAMMSIGGVKAVEIGAGCAMAEGRGSQWNDALSPEGYLSNHAGGVAGGISTGEPLRITLSVKPTPSIGREQQTVDADGQPRSIRVEGRHDPCLCPRIVPVAEAMLLLCLGDALLAQRALGRLEEPA